MMVGMGAEQTLKGPMASTSLCMARLIPRSCQPGPVTSLAAPEGYQMGPNFDQTFQHHPQPYTVNGSLSEIMLTRGVPCPWKVH